MPNNIHNVLVFKTPELYEKFVSKYVSHKKTEVEEWDCVDFDKIIPAPKSLEECPEKYVLRTPEDHRNAGIEDEYFYNWYTWNVDNWSTKWNAYCNELYPDRNAVYFDTAWEPPTKVYNKLKEIDKDFNKDNVRIQALCEFSQINELIAYDFDESGFVNDSENKDAFVLLKVLSDEADALMENAIVEAYANIKLFKDFLSKEEHKEKYEAASKAIKELAKAYEISLEEV